MADTIETAPAAPTVRNVAEIFGNGRYSNIAKELYRDTQRIFGLTPKQAETVAKAYVSEFARCVTTGTKVGKVNADGFTTLSESAKIKGVKMTPALNIGKLTSIVNEMGAYGAERVLVDLDDNIMSWVRQHEQD